MIGSDMSNCNGVKFKGITLYRLNQLNLNGTLEKAAAVLGSHDIIFAWVIVSNLNGLGSYNPSEGGDTKT